MFDDWAVIDPGEAKEVRCGDCAELGREVTMEADAEWLPGRVRDVWRCPECGRVVGRGEGERWL